MATNILNDFTSFDNISGFLVEGDSLEQMLNGEDETNSHKLKRNVRKAIDNLIERKRLRNAISDELK